MLFIQKFIFIHIFKTGGSSTIELLESIVLGNIG